MWQNLGMGAWEYGRLVFSLAPGENGGLVIPAALQWVEQWQGPTGAIGTPIPLTDAVASFNRLGADGWEMIVSSEDRQIYQGGTSGATAVRYIFKRPKEG
jgi:hypothetical protein